VPVAAVQLDGEPVLGPVAVENVGAAARLDRDVGLGLFEAGAAPELGEAVLELAADHLARTVLRDRPLQCREFAAAVGAFNGGIEGVEVEEPLELRLSHCP